MENSIIKDIDEQMLYREDKDLSQSGTLRELLDSRSAEWNDSDLDTKIEALQILVNERNENVLKLLLGMMTTYNDDRDSNHITPMDLTITLATFTEALLKKRL